MQRNPAAGYQDSGPGPSAGEPTTSGVAFYEFVFAFLNDLRAGSPGIVCLDKLTIYNLATDPINLCDVPAIDNTFNAARWLDGFSHRSQRIERKARISSSLAVSVSPALPLSRAAVS